MEHMTEGEVNDNHNPINIKYLPSEITGEHWEYEPFFFSYSILELMNTDEHVSQTIKVFFFKS